MYSSITQLGHLFRQRPWVYAILLNAVSMAYVVTQYQPESSIRVELLTLRSHIDELRANLALSDDNLSTRLDTIEQTLYGEIAPELKEKRRPIVTVAPSTWQRNRDAEFERRIQALERWRLFDHREP